MFSVGVSSSGFGDWPATPRILQRFSTHSRTMARKRGSPACPLVTFSVPSTFLPLDRTFRASAFSWDLVQASQALRSTSSSLASCRALNSVVSASAEAFHSSRRAFRSRLIVPASTSKLRAISCWGSPRRYAPSDVLAALEDCQLLFFRCTAHLALTLGKLQLLGASGRHVELAIDLDAGLRRRIWTALQQPPRLPQRRACSTASMGKR